MATFVPLIFTALMSLFLAVPICAELSITYAMPNIKTPSANAEYELDILQLALNKTTASYGAYKINLVEKNFNEARSLVMLQDDLHENYIQSFGFDSSLTNDSRVEHIRFPIYLGLLGLRTCFHSQKHQQKLASIKSKNDFFGLNQGIGIGWVDGDILRHSNVKVTEIQSYSSLFSMTAIGRIDLFCRGTSEVLGDYKQYMSTPGLRYDKRFAIYYPIPMFFYTNAKNKDLVKRLTEGLSSAHNDQSLQTLWRRHFKESIDFISLEKRKIFYLPNPHLKSIDLDYEKYFMSFRK